MRHSTQEGRGGGAVEPGSEAAGEEVQHAEAPLAAGGDHGQHPLDEPAPQFKTPGLRDLGHSAPYLLTGRMSSLEDVIRFYGRFSELMRQGRIRNGAPQLRRMFLTDEDTAPLVAFLRSLNKDYD